MQYVILAAGHGERFVKGGYTTPKSLLRVPGYLHTLMEGVVRVVDLFADHNDETFLVMNPKTYAVAQATGVFHNIPLIQYLSVDYSVSSVASALSMSLSRLNPNEPVMFLDCDAIYAFDLATLSKQFATSGADVGTLTVPATYFLEGLSGLGKFSAYPSQENPVTPYHVKTVTKENVQPQDVLNTGVYMYRRTEEFIRAACAYMSQDGAEHTMPEVFKHHSKGVRTKFQTFDLSTLRQLTASETSPKGKVLPYSDDPIKLYSPWRPLGSPEEYTAYENRVNICRRKVLSADVPS